MSTWCHLYVREHGLSNLLNPLFTTNKHHFNKFSILDSSHILDPSYIDDSTIFEAGQENLQVYHCQLTTPVWEPPQALTDYNSQVGKLSRHRTSWQHFPLRLFLSRTTNKSISLLPEYNSCLQFCETLSRLWYMYIWFKRGRFGQVNWSLTNLRSVSYP